MNDIIEEETQHSCFECVEFPINICEECLKKIKKEEFDKGYKKALDDHNILYGKQAKKFLKDTGLDKLN